MCVKKQANKHRENKQTNRLHHSTNMTISTDKSQTKYHRWIFGNIAVNRSLAIKYNKPGLDSKQTNKYPSQGFRMYFLTFYIFFFSHYLCCWLHFLHFGSTIHPSTSPPHNLPTHPATHTPSHTPSLQNSPLGKDHWHILLLSSASAERLGSDADIWLEALRLFSL